ncbi:MAG: hypothetical protein K6E10_08330 [Eubacterium sp.]|nr:hypothetical protein [Eubacterium sp.]
MDYNKKNWTCSRDNLVRAVRSLDFPEEFGCEIAKNLGSPKAMDRMTAYLLQAKPKSIEMVVDEMLAICSEIEAWKVKKDSLEANARYNELLNNGLGNDDE